MERYQCVYYIMELFDIMNDERSMDDGIYLAFLGRVWGIIKNDKVRV